MYSVSFDYCHSASELTKIYLPYLFCLQSLNTRIHFVSFPNSHHLSFYLVNLPQTWTLCYGLGRGALLSLPLVATTFRWSIRLPLSLRGGSCSRALRQSAPTTHRDEQRSQHYCNQQYVNSYDVLTKLIYSPVYHGNNRILPPKSFIIDRFS